MVKPYTLDYTDAAKRLIAIKSNMETMNGKVLDELEEIFKDAKGECVGEALIFHTVFFSPDNMDDSLFIYPVSDHVLEVDAAAYDEGEEMTEGPFAGMKIKMPTPESK